MKVIIFGASGPTGVATTRRALALGHTVTAVTRRPDAFPLRDTALTVAAADVQDAASLDAVLPGHDAVISVVGVPYSRKPVTVYSQGIASLDRAMSRHGLRRLVCVTSKEAVRTVAPGEPLPYRLVLNPFLRLAGRTLYADMRRMEQQLHSSDLDWTVVRPGGLFHTVELSDYLVTEDHVAGVFTALPDLADFLVREADNPEHTRRPVEVLTRRAAPSVAGFVARTALGQLRARLS